MRKSDDDIKLDISEIFGDDWAKEPKNIADVPLPDTAMPAVPDIAATMPGAEIKFNDETVNNTPANEPVVITVIQKVHREGTEGTERTVGVETAKPTSGQVSGSTMLRQPGTSSSESSLVMRPGMSAKKDPTFEDLLGAFDRLRLIFNEELNDTAGPRKTLLMLNKTFEAAREKNPEVFRNANWDPTGNLIEDGSLNVARMVENRNALDSKLADMVTDTALTFLLTLRLQAIEKGLGPDVANRIRTRMKSWADEESQKEGSGKNDPRILKKIAHFLV